MLLAGEDTTAFTLARTIHQLRDRPRWAAEPRSEADAVIGSGNDLDTANRLARANAVADETMRLRPVAPFLGFLANVDMALGDVFVPEGTGVVALLRPLLSIKRTSSTRSPFWFEEARGPHNVSTHLPFGSGHGG
jgi:cytochrome P450